MKLLLAWLAVWLLAAVARASTEASAEVAEVAQVAQAMVGATAMA